MNQSKRNFMKVLPVAALSAATTVKLGNNEAKGYELQPNKKYLLVFPNASIQDLQQCANALRARGLDALACNAEPQIYDIE